MPWRENPLVTFETKIQFNLREILPAYFPSVPTLQHPRRARLDSLQSQIGRLEYYTVSMLASTKALIGTAKNILFFFITFLFLMRNLGQRASKARAKFLRWLSVAGPVSVSDYPPFSKHLGPLPSTGCQRFLSPPHTHRDRLFSKARVKRSRTLPLLPSVYC